MAAPSPTYDLVLLLDPEAEDATRARLVSEARDSITSQGELLRHDEWGGRALNYPIHRRSAAEYHLMQFHANSPELLRSLDRSLRIADDVLRFRIIKLRPGTPEPPQMRGTGPGARRPDGGQPGTGEPPQGEEPRAARDPDGASAESEDAGVPPAEGGEAAAGENA